MNFQNGSARASDQTKRGSDEGGKGKTTMSGSSSRTVHCPCGRVSECTGAETFLQHDAHQAASAPLPLFLNTFFFEHFKMFASFLTVLQHETHPAADANPVTRVSNRHAAEV